MWFDPAEFPGEKVKDIQIPSLILLGDRDEYIPLSEAIEMHKLMPNTELAIILTVNMSIILFTKNSLIKL